MQYRLFVHGQKARLEIKGIPCLPNMVIVDISILDYAAVDASLLPSAAPKLLMLPSPMAANLPPLTFGRLCGASSAASGTESDRGGGGGGGGALP